MKTKTIAVILFILSASVAYAEPVARYSGKTYLGCGSIGDSRVWLNDPSDYGSVKAGYIYVPDGCSSLPAVASKYLKVSGGQVVEMNTVEKAAVDILEGQAVQAQKDAQDAKLEVSQEEALTALVQVINLRLPAGQKITKQELINQIKANRN